MNKVKKILSQTPSLKKPVEGRLTFSETMFRRGHYSCLLIVFLQAEKVIKVISVLQECPEAPSIFPTAHLTPTIDWRRSYDKD